MELSKRLLKIAEMVDPCDCAADIGTDHAYIPIYLIKNHICKNVIASDINDGPVKKARYNIALENLQGNIKCIKSEGLTHLSPFEADCAVIAGMGGNLIRDIIEQGSEVFKSLKFIVLNPVQNVEVLREYIYKSGYEILDENLCVDENIFYEIIKIRYANRPKKVDSIFYEISEMMIKKKHPLVGSLIEKKICENEIILNSIKQGTDQADRRRKEISSKICKLEELLECL